MFSRWKKRQQAAALDQLWDQLQAAEGSRPLEPNARPANAEMISKVLAHDDAPAIDPVFSATLRKDLTNMHAQHEFQIGPNGHGSPAATVGEPRVIGQRPWIRERRAWNATPRIRMVAGLVVLAILLALSALALDPGRTPEPPAIPAAVIQDQYESETLVDISFPPGRMRGEDGAQIVFAENRVPPGNTIEFHFSCDSHGIIPFHVLEGTLAAEVAGTSFVLRAGASEWETILTGETAEMRAGDTWFFENTSKDGMTNLRNPGPDDLRYLAVGTRQNLSRCDQSPPSGQQMLWFKVEDPSGPLDPAQPVRLLLRKVTMPVGSEMEGEIGGFPVPSVEQEAIGARQWAKILSGALTITRASDGVDDSETSTWREPTVLVLSQDLTRSTEDERVVLSNESDDIVELLVLDIIVGDPGAQGGVAPPPEASPEANS